MRRTSTGRRVAAVAVALAALVGGCTSKSPETRPAAGAASSPASSPSPGPVTGPDGGIYSRIPDVVRQVEPSVVTIFVGGGLGSGVVYSRDSIVVTNEHVVREADGGRVEVAFADGQRVRGQVRAADRVTDLAIVAVDRKGVPPAQFRTELPRVGELAVVLGSPLGFENTATAGIISGLNRSIPGSGRQSQPLVDLIQTDAPISPGNSGGALVDAQGRVVGISEAYIPPQVGAVSLGFAIRRPRSWTWSSSSAGTAGRSTRSSGCRSRRSPRRSRSNSASTARAAWLSSMWWQTVPPRAPGWSRET